MGKHDQAATPEQLARHHIDLAIQLTNRTFVELYVTQCPTTTVTTTGPPASPKSGRGRRPGAAPTEQRCSWKMADDAQCKNAKTAQTEFCKLHVSKASLVTSAGGGEQMQ
jgi:hypothetical protein